MEIINGRSSIEKLRELIFSEKFNGMLSKLEVYTEVIENGHLVGKGGSIILERKDISGYKGTLDEIVNQINLVFKENRIPYYSSLYVNRKGNLNVRIYRISEEFEIEKYPDTNKKISKCELDELRKRFIGGHKIGSKDDFYNDLFIWDDSTNSGIPLSNDEVIYALSIDTKRFDRIILDDRTKSLMIHVIKPKEVKLEDMISLMKKFRPEDMEFEDGWITMWFD